MPRSVRLQWPGAHYHVMAPGNRRQAIFRDADDQHFFLKGLDEACARTGWRVHAWVLMGNHYHLHVETPEPNLPGSDSRKVEIASKVWEQTTAGQTWIAERLHMKSAANVSQILRRASPSRSAVKIC